MKLQFTILPALCLILFTSCKPTPAVSYEHSGISFTCPQGWTITEEKHKENAHYLFVEKNGYKASGLITITWIDGELEWEEYMGINMDTFRSKEELKELNFSEPNDTTFNGNAVLATNYTFSIQDMPHTGKLLILGSDYRTIGIIMQEADKDNEANKDGFATFRESFSFTETEDIAE